MAKEGLDYFPLDCLLNEKFELIEAEFGLTGFAVVVKMLQRIYGVRGYYCEWNNEVALLFGRSCGTGGNVVSEIIEASVRRGIFSEELFNKYHILTSKGIQERYFEAVSRRKEVQVKNEYLLIKVSNLYKNVSISTDNVDIKPKNADISKQSKGEESRVKDIKKNSHFVPPTPEEVKAYCIERNNKVDAERFIDFYSSKGWMIGKNKMKDWKAAVRTWEKDKKPDTQPKPAQNKFNQYPQRQYTETDYAELERKLLNKGV